MTGGIPVDLILFGMVAAFLVLRLRSVLGRRTGFERPVQPEVRPAGFDPRGARTVEGTAEDVAPVAPTGGMNFYVGDHVILMMREDCTPACAAAFVG